MFELHKIKVDIIFKDCRSLWGSKIFILFPKIFRVELLYFSLSSVRIYRVIHKKILVCGCLVYVKLNLIWENSFIWSFSSTWFYKIIKYSCCSQKYSETTYTMFFFFTICVNVHGDLLEEFLDQSDLLIKLSKSTRFKWSCYKLRNTYNTLQYLSVPEIHEIVKFSSHSQKHFIPTLRYYFSFEFIQIYIVTHTNSLKY